MDEAVQERVVWKKVVCGPSFTGTGGDNNDNYV